MDFAGVARSIRREEPDKFRGSAAAVVGNVNPSKVLDITSGKAAKAARDSAASIVALMRCTASTKGGNILWQRFDAGVREIQAQLSRDAVQSHVFQEQLLLAISRGEGSVHGEERGAGVEEQTLALYWRLHESGLLPLSKMLEATEALPCGGEGQRRFCEYAVSGMRALALQSSRAGGAGFPREHAAALVSDVAKHLFDLAYRVRSQGSGALTARAARMMLDQLCCGQQLLGTNGGEKDTEARLRGCLSVLVAIAQGGCVPGDVSVAVFLTRQMRLLIENSSGQHGEASWQGEVAGLFETNKAAPDGGSNRLLFEILRIFPSAECIEALRSVCRKAVARAIDSTGLHLHKPLLFWETLGPVVRAAATAHPQEIPAALALVGTEMAETAVDFTPSGDGNLSRTAGCNQQQGVLVLSAALRLVQAADISQGTSKRRSGQGGLYTQWFTSCFGPQKGEDFVVQRADQADIRPAPQGSGYETRVPEPHEEGSRLSGSEAVREAMEKQRAMEILMEALCLSVPEDPAFVLKVHKDVLISRLRAKFSVQVRDYVDLCATRIADLGQDAARRCKGPETGQTGHDRSPGVEGSGSANRETSHRHGDCSDPTTREVGFFLRQFQQSGEVPLALKTAILWQPKSWASFRKVLLAPPAERIAMPDRSGKMSPMGVVVTETIGGGENGLRVEVSLKYRRLLVQKLHKESLLSAKDHETFRKSYVEFLQNQRSQDNDKSDACPNTAAAATAVTRQLLLLESRQREEASQKEESMIAERLGLLLQEYLPRALVVELSMEEEANLPDRDWFARATHLLTQILEEWKQGFLAGEGSPGVQAASAEEVAEAILNSVHCCVAAVGASLLLPHQPGHANEGAIRGQERSGMDVLPAPLDLPTVQAFRRIGEVVTIAAGAELSIGDAIFRRCSSLLLANPNALDPKQLLSLSHILAALPPAFHVAVTTFFASLVAKILRPVSADNAGLAVTAQIAAFYLHSTLFLHEDVWKSAAGSSNEADPAHSDERQFSGTGKDNSTPSCRGLAPVVLLEFCWWMERRLSIAQQQQQLQSANFGPHLSVEKAGLLRLLRGVVKHPLLELALDRALEIRGSTTPPLERLVAFELAASNVKNFGGASTRLGFFESVTVGRLVVDSSSDAGGPRCVSIKEVWKECMEVLLVDPHLREACRALVCRDTTPSEWDELVGSTWRSFSHSSWRAGGRPTSDSEGVQGVLDSILQVVSKLCSLEAAAGSMLGGTGTAATEANVPPFSVDRSPRNASLLLTESLAQLLPRLQVDAPGPALVLVAEITIPTIGATEGREKAMASLRLMWQEWLCKARPLAYGAIVRLVRLALMWSGARSDAKQSEECPVAHVLEDLPLLASEMARVWPRLSRTLMPVIGCPARTGPYASGGWASRLSDLHQVGAKLDLDFAGGWASSTSDSPPKGAAIPSSTRPSTKNSSGRVPLGPVNNDSRRDLCSKKPLSARCGLGMAEASSTSTALPCTSAQLVVGVLLSASLRLYPSCRVPPGPSKRAKTDAGSATDRRVQETGVYGGRRSDDPSQPSAIPLQPPATSAWVERFLKPVYGPDLEALGVLLSTLIIELGKCRNPSGDGEGNGSGTHTDAYQALVVAILVFAPTLVARLAERPCLTGSDSPTSPTERMGRSLAVLDSLKLLREEGAPSSPEKPMVWLTVVLSHYIAALLSTSKGRDGGGRAWSDVAAFVHESVAKVARQDLGQLPGALRLAAKEVDPLLKQYL